MAGPVRKYFADRGPHLAAMIAYFALLSLVPLVFLALALLGVTGRAQESSYLVTEFRRFFPSQSVEGVLRVVSELRENALAFGIAGVVFLAWSSLSLFSVLESAFNVVYGRPNRPFLLGKALALGLLVSSLVVLFAGLVVASVGIELGRHYAEGALANVYVAFALSVLVSTAATFAFLVAVYYLLTNEQVDLREVMPGAAMATLLLQVTFQILPAYVRVSRDFATLQAFGAPAILLVWLYLMANLIVLGAELNWWLARRPPVEGEEAAGLA
ncbi:MAG: YihY/virulence factor BrkB family protein [Thermoleophilia bacterium]|nr:YihY/virulence factor BrkB family protein [Thermoleophilia bacterium]